MATSWDATILPDFSVEEFEWGIKNLISKGEAGKERRRNKVSTAKRGFRLNFGSALTTTQVDWIWTHYVDRKGILLTFTWTRPARSAGDSAVQYTVRFETDGLTRAWFNANQHRLSLVFVEAI